MEAVFRPDFRFALKARIIESGYRSAAQFARSIGITFQTLSPIINGWKIPSPGLQKRLAEGLGLTLAELKHLL